MSQSNHNLICNKVKFTALLREECVKAGWSIERINEDCFLAAQREVISLGKTDMADIFSVSGDEFYGVLRSQYETQGNNILSTHAVLFDWDISDSEFSQLAANYIKQVDDIINNSKFVKMYLNSQ
ncbi:hypothetical protein [Photobacterium leiognathi]|uniref:hypothetical protein n=1 Tax=Photobacterium leiognathi TaxID=553611 RepID=UPI00298159BC|nr:hypothetical protein [Photobacterium leiognathi]